LQAEPEEMQTFLKQLIKISERIPGKEIFNM